MTNVLVLIPCRDEGASVASVVEGFRKELPDARILVVDNGSRDDTGERAARAGATPFDQKRVQRHRHHA